MRLLDIVEKLEKKSDEERYAYVCQTLQDWNVPYHIHQYETGKNIIYKPAGDLPIVAIGSHFDVVYQSAGANDNASAIAVALDILHKSLQHHFKTFRVAFFCFDQEEEYLQGSAAYIERYGISDLLGLYNLEMLGQGDKFALWSLNPESQGLLLETFEKTAQEKKIASFRFDQIVTNLADHVNFFAAGLEETFTITCISDADIAASVEYYQAQAQNKGMEELFKILKKAPLFEHYHLPTDLSMHLSEDALQMTAQTLWQTLLNLDIRRQG